MKVCANPESIIGGFEATLTLFRYFTENGGMKQHKPGPQYSICPVFLTQLYYCREVFTITMSEGVDKGYFAEKEFLIPLKFIPLNFQHILM